MKREVFAGIKSAYQAEDLIGRLTVMAANLAPHEMNWYQRRHGPRCWPGGEELFILSLITVQSQDSACHNMVSPLAGWFSFFIRRFCFLGHMR